MVQIAGKYQHEKNENLKEFILGLGVDEGFATKSDGMTATMEITVNGETINIKNIYPDNTIVLNITPGKEFDDPMPNGENLKSVATLNGNTLSVISKKDGAEIGNRSYEFSDSGCVMTLGAKATPIVAKRYFKRV